MRDERDRTEHHLTERRGLADDGLGDGERHGWRSMHSSCHAADARGDQAGAVTEGSDARRRSTAQADTSGRFASSLTPAAARDTATASAKRPDVTGTTPIET